MTAANLAPEPGGTLGDTAVARSPVLRQLAVVFVGLVLGLVTVDVAIGRYDSAKDLSDKGLLAWDETLSWTNRPGFENKKSRISSLGLRSPEIPGDAPSAEVRILGVGASRTFGAGKRGPNMFETWSHYLEAMANSELEGDWRILNGGVMGYSMRQSVRRAIQLLDATQPDLVIVFVSPGRQLLLDPSSARNITQLPSGRLIPKDLERLTPTALMEPVAAVHGFLLENSTIYSRYRYQFTDKGVVKRSNLKYVISSEPPPPDVADMLADSLDELEIMAKLCEQRGIELRAAILLEAFQDCERHWKAYLRNGATTGAPPIGTPRSESTEILTREFADRGVQSWSMNDAITLTGTNRAKYTCDNAHWSAAGHRVIAEHLFRALTDEGMDERLIENRRKLPR